MTTQQRDSLLRMAIDDTTRHIAQAGVTLTWDEMDELGDEVAQWMRDRLALRIDGSCTSKVCWRPKE